MKAPQKLDDRNYGVDLLRIVSMCMVIVLHILGRGGVLDAASPNSINYHIGWLLESAAIAATNCYALISGYVGANRKVRYSNLAYLWLQVAVYSIGITVLYWIFAPERVSTRILIEASLPLFYGKYWYFTAYFGMYLFAPALNMAIRNLSARKLGMMLVVAGIFLIPVSLITDEFVINGGYSAFWLAYLYLWGGLLSKVKVNKGRKWLMVYAAMTVLTYGLYFLLETVGSKFIMSRMMLTPVSPTVVLASLALFIFFTNLKIPRFLTGPIRFFAPLSFGVYLIHTQTKIFESMRGDFAFLGRSNPLVLVGCAVVAAVGIYVVCALLDFVRLKIFELLRVKPLLRKLEAWAVGQCGKLVNKVHL